MSMKVDDSIMLNRLCLFCKFPVLSLLVDVSNRTLVFILNRGEILLVILNLGFALGVGAVAPLGSSALGSCCC